MYSDKNMDLRQLKRFFSQIFPLCHRSEKSPMFSATSLLDNKDGICFLRNIEGVNWVVQRVNILF